MGRWSKYESDRSPENPIGLVIRIFNRQKDLKIGKSSARALVQSTLEYLKISYDEVAIYFVTEKKIAQLHEQFFQDPSSTDCISFPMAEWGIGEVFVCPAVAVQYARKRNLDPYEEASLYVVHGLLHLLGYDDLKKRERTSMRKKEKSCMHHLYKIKKFLSSK